MGTRGLLDEVTQFFCGGNPEKSRKQENRYSNHFDCSSTIAFNMSNYGQRSFANI